jgi:hypothetical protein
MSELNTPVASNWFMAAQSCFNILQDVGPYTGMSNNPDSETAHRIEDELGKIFTSFPELMQNEMIAARIQRLSLQIREVEADKWSASTKPLFLVTSSPNSPKTTDTYQEGKAGTLHHIRLGEAALGELAS